MAMAALLAACSEQAAQPAHPGPIGEPQVVTLGAGESFVAVSPSGEELVTAMEPTVPDGADDWVREFCIRTGPAYAEATCTDTGRYGVGTWGATWNADGSRLAFVQPGSRNSQGVQDVVWVLDLASGAAEPVTPEEWIADTPDLAWAGDGRLLYTWATDARTELRALDVDGPTGEPETVATLGDVEVRGLFVVDDVPWVAGEVREGESATRAGLYVVSDGASGAPADLRPVLEHSLDESLVGLSQDGARAVVQGWDTHFAVPPEVHDLATGERTRINADGGPEEAVAAVAFGPDGHDRLVSVSYDGVGTSISLFDEDLDLVGERWIDRAERTYYYNGVDLTDRGITAVSSTDGQPQQVLVFPVEG